MMKNKWFLILITCGLISCNRGGENNLISRFVKISENENAGVQDVLNFYGGKCEYSIGMTISNREENKKQFKLKLEGSPFLENYIETPEYLGTNIAYRFYRHLNKKERKNYSSINPTIRFKNGTEKPYEISTWELEIVDKKIPFVDKVVNIIREKKYDDLIPLLDDSTILQYDKEAFIDSLKVVDPQFGNITEEGFRIFGYKFFDKNDQGDEFLYLSGALVRDKQSNAFSIVVDPYSDKEEIFLLRYEM